LAGSLSCSRFGYLAHGRVAAAPGVHDRQHPLGGTSLMTSGRWVNLR